MKKIDFFFDLSSPYSYMAATQIGSIAQKYDAELAWRPFVLGAVFKAVGHDMPTLVSPKTKWMWRDLQQWAEAYGVPFQFTSRFPVNAISAERLVLAAGEKAGQVALGAFRAVWVEDRDITAESELRRIAAAAGLDADKAYAAISSQPIKDQLRANTDEAIARGAFGAPSIFVGDELFWGNDRLPFVERALAAR